MKVIKKVIGNLNKCYALTVFNYQNKEHLLCAAEKKDPCLMFDLDGNYEDTLWDGPGGVMTLEEVPGGSGVLLATRRFYSFNDGSEADIVYVRNINGHWITETLVSLPFVHRFGIIRQGNTSYLVAATIKSAHTAKDDWSSPGKVWIGELTDPIETYNSTRQLAMEPLVDGLFRNHGFCKCKSADGEFVLIGSDSGVLKIQPPSEPDGDWVCDQLLDQSASDMIYLDFDQDGERELLVFSPFHGNQMRVYKQMSGQFTEVYRHPEELPFLHAICGGEIRGITYGFVGNRGGLKELLAIHYNRDKGCYETELLDSGAGPANVMFYSYCGHHLLLAANREINEIAVYDIDSEQ